MITTQLLRPESIVVVGASNNVHKPGGAILKNLINGGYQGELRAVNPKETEVQGVPAFADVKGKFPQFHGFPPVRTFFRYQSVL